MQFDESSQLEKLIKKRQKDGNQYNNIKNHKMQVTTDTIKLVYLLIKINV